MPPQMHDAPVLAPRPEVDRQRQPYRLARLRSASELLPYREFRISFDWSVSMSCYAFPLTSTPFSPLLQLPVSAPLSPGSSNHNSVRDTRTRITVAQFSGGKSRLSRVSSMSSGRLA